MSNERPGIPDILPQLLEEMRRRGYNRELIAGFRKLWNALSPDTRILPCPICYEGRWFVGKLELLPTDQYGNEIAVCLICNTKIVLGKYG